MVHLEKSYKSTCINMSESPYQKAMETLKQLTQLVAKVLSSKRKQRPRSMICFESFTEVKEVLTISPTPSQSSLW